MYRILRSFVTNVTDTAIIRDTVTDTAMIRDIVTYAVIIRDTVTGTAIIRDTMLLVTNVTDTVDNSTYIAIICEQNATFTLSHDLTYVGRLADPVVIIISYVLYTIQFTGCNNEPRLYRNTAHTCLGAINGSNILH